MNDITKPEPTEVAVSRVSVPDDFLLQIVRDGSIDAAKLQVAADVFIQLQDKQRQWAREHDAEEARREWLAAMAQAQAEYPIIPRSTPNPHTKKNYSDYATIWRLCSPIWTRHGLYVSNDAEDTPNGLIDVSCAVSHSRGHREVFHAPAAPPDDKGPQGSVNKTRVQGNQATITYIQRGLLCRAMGIVTAEEDDDGQSGGRLGSARDRATAGMITEDQRDQINELLEKVKQDRPKFLDYYHTDAVENMSQDAAQHAIRMLTDKLRRIEAEAKAPPESTAEPEAPAKAPRKRAQTAPVADAQPTAQEPPAQQEPAAEALFMPFEAFLLDEIGEPIRDDSFTDVVQYVIAFMRLWEKSSNREALFEQNADGIADAKAIPAAATILDSMAEAPPKEEAAPDPDQADMAKFKSWLTDKNCRYVEDVTVLARNPLLANTAARWRKEEKMNLITELQQAYKTRMGELPHKPADAPN